jgi:SagB-type dehydrogenase family enzyme
MPDATGVVLRYHERTKHHFQRMAASLGHLDWATQPDPFRTFAGAAQIALPRDARPEACDYDDLFRPGAVAAQPLTLRSVSSFLMHSMAISAWKQFGASRWALRVNPSSGNLHPTEAYVVLPALDGVHTTPGVYHYQSKDHRLERRATMPDAQAAAQLEALAAGGFIVGLSSILWREAWKYGERAFRYCQHDTGHAIAALGLSAALHGWQLRPCLDRGDDDVAALLGLNREADFGDAEREEPDTLMIVSPADSPDAKTVAAALDALQQAAVGAEWTGKANRLSRDHHDWPVIPEVAAACHKPRTPPAGPRPAAESLEIAAPRGLDAATIIRQRRSAVAMDGVTTLPAADFFRMMTRAMPQAGVPAFAGLGPPACVHLALFVHRVDGLTPGVYALARSPEGLAALRESLRPAFSWERPDGCPDGLPLYLLAEGDCRGVATQLSCMQDIAGDGAFSLGMLAEFEPRLRTQGAWLYRRLFWETGAIGQVLYLEAEAAGIRATGIGCFFDDPVHSLLGLTGRRFQSLYHFTVGGPVEDGRLTTLPAYGD